MKKLLFCLCGLCLFCGGYAQSPRLTVEDCLREGVELHDAGKYREAITLYEKAAVLDPSCVVAYYEMALSYSALKQQDKVLSLCRKIFRMPEADTYPGLPHVYSLCGSAYDDKGDVEAALAVYDQGIARCRDRYAGGLWPLYLNKGIALYRAERSAEAESAFSEAMNDNPLHPSAHFHLGNLRFLQGDRVGCLPSYFFFLLLAPRGERAEQVWDCLEKITGSYAEKTDKGVTLTLASNATDIRMGLHLAAALADSCSQFPEALIRVRALFRAFKELYGLTRGLTDGEPKVTLAAVYRRAVFPYLMGLEKAGCSDAVLCYMASGVCPEAREWLKARPGELDRLTAALKNNGMEK